ncbi:MAG: 2'-5' RNA ligase family protein [Actinobacteria bacterium]|uniref:2'-5' RNA ligase family protein n=1 Tax=Nostocoides veronense TaxID=330836 RepID=A0ABP4XRD0_9MICO|nr:2'-5' RNA ligase family protein [Actinomycetota bacterium]
MLTIGISIEVPEPYGGYLQDAREAFGDPLARAIPAHITLLPPTVIDPADAAPVAGHLAEVATAYAPFDVILSGTGTFRPVSPVAFVALASGAEQCAALESAVRAGPLARELDFPYHPHVTIAHHLDDAALTRAQAQLANFRAAFRVSALHLYHHGDDEIWRPVQAFDLTGV